jgi:serine/threonine protein kinase/tetratricopeptide (TPR) repeat protein
MWTDDATVVTGNPPTSPRRPLDEGDTIDRYRVIERVGRGAMGVVYRAHDPELGRDVAVKLASVVPSGTGESDEPTRLKAEAQTLARISHPNVVTILDVGEHEGEVFLAMELVRGPTLRQWLDARRRPWMETLAVVCAVGRGLAAVHAAGLIHRDVKPGNVMVGDDGRVRLMDFGLASSAVDDASTLGGSVGDGPGGSSSSGASSHPRGTLPYMAPEQHRTGVLDARADQFALCVTMHEALYGEHPFEGESPLSIAVAIVEGRLRPLPTDAAVPARVGRVIRQGLAAAPEGRWPDVATLLRAIERAAARPRRLRWLAGLSVGALVMAGAVTLAVVEWEQPSDPCEGVERSIVESWGPERQAEARARFEAAGPSFVEASWPRVDEAMARHREEWSAARVSACRTGTAGEDVAERVACLERHRRAFDGLAHELARADDITVRMALEAAGRLPPVSECEDLRRAGERELGPRDPAERARHDELAHRLAEVQALALLDRHEAVRDALVPLEPLVRDSAQPALLGELLALRGKAERNLGRAQVAESLLEESYFAFESMGAHRRSAWVAWQLADLVGRLGGRPDDARAWLRRGELALGRLDEIDAELEGQHQRILASIAELDGDFDAVVEHQRRAFELTEQHRGPEALETLRQRENHGNAVFMAGRSDEAVRILREVIDGYERLVGPRHPATISPAANLAAMLTSLGRTDEAAAVLERSIAVTEDGHVLERHMAAQALRTLAFIRVLQQRFDEARQLAKRRLALQGRLTPEPHALLADAIGSLATIEQLSGDSNEAALGFRRQLDMLDALGQAAETDYRQALSNWAIVLLVVMEPTEVLARLEPVVEQLVETLGTEHPTTIMGRLMLASARHHIDPRLGIPELEALDALPFTDVDVRAHLLLVLIKAQAPIDLERARATMARLEAIEGKGDERRMIEQYRAEARKAIAKAEREGNGGDSKEAKE